MKKSEFDMTSLIETGNSMSQHLDQIFAGIQIKAALASVSALFISALGGGWFIFELWFILNVIDLICGVSLAIKDDCFSRRRIYDWVIKTFTHILTIILIGFVSFTLSYLAKYNIPILDWFVFVLVLTEVASIFNSLIKLGLPVPPLAQKIVAKIRNRTESKIDDFTDGDDEQKEK